MRTLKRLLVAPLILAAALMVLPPSAASSAFAVTIPVPTATRPLVIQTEGDSITEGANTAPVADSYRTELGRLLDAAGVPYRFVNDYHSGWSCAQLRSTGPAVVKANDPDFLLLDCGTNDMPTASTAQAFHDTYQGLLNDLWAASPSGQLKILPSWITYSAAFNQSPNIALQSSEPIVNDAIYQVWINAPQRYAGTLTTPVDFQNLPEAYLGSVGIHPTVAGYAVMARAWYLMLRNSYYPNAGWPDPPTTCGLTGHRPGGYTPSYTPCNGAGTP